MNVKKIHLAAIIACSISVGYWLGTTPVTAENKNQTPDPKKPVATIAGTTLTVAELEAKVNEVPEYLRRNFLKVDGKKKLLENMVKGEILYVAAKDAGYDEHPEVQEKVEETVRSIYQSEYFKREIQNAVVKHEEKAREYYDKHKETKYAIGATRKVRHIMVADRATAIQIKQELENGGTWKALSEQHNLDRNTRSSGGYLGYLGDNDLISGLGREPQFNDAIFAAEKGAVSGPVKSSRGWHVFQVEDINPPSFEPFDEVKQDIGDMFLVTDEMVKAEYEKTKETYINRENINVSHIQVNSEEEAKQVAEKLAAGEDWTKLARMYSQDSSSATKGGDVGKIFRGGIIKGIGRDDAVMTKLFEMRSGDVSGPTKAASGSWHIFKVTGYQPETKKAYAEVAPTIRTRLLREAREDLLENEFDKLKSKYNVKVFEENIVDTSWTMTEPQLKPTTPQQGGTTGFPFGQ